MDKWSTVKCQIKFGALGKMNINMENSRKNYTSILEKKESSKGDKRWKESSR